MKAKRFKDATTHEAANHRGYTSLALTITAEQSKGFTNGASHFLPGGSTGPNAEATEKTSTTFAGEFNVIVGGQEPALKPFNTCYICAGERREINSRGNEEATMLVAVEMPKEVPAPLRSPT